ncbi:Hypothetical membrane protein [Propionibacterium freudenreichii]|nr:Hypothetical membrane protein [Propionibacterium freudenreichii]
MFTASLGVFLFGLLAAIAGGAVGAAIGGNYAFVLTGFAVIASWGIFAATGNTFGLDYLAFGPFMGPHIAFAGGVAAAIYARYRGYFEDGKDVNSPLAGLGKPDIVYVGSLFGIFGYLCQIGVSHIPWFGTHTDSVALSVLLSGLLARVVFGGLPGKGLMRGSLHNAEAFHPDATTFPQKIKPAPTAAGWNGRRSPPSCSRSVRCSASWPVAPPCSWPATSVPTSPSGASPTPWPPPTPTASPSASRPS